MIRTFLLLFISVYLSGQELYPGQIPCFCVPNFELSYNGNGQKAWKIYCKEFSINGCSGGVTTQDIGVTIRDTTNTAWASTDYYNQVCNDTINEVIRLKMATLKPGLGLQDDIGFVFNTRTKDPPTIITNPTCFPCDAAVGGSVGGVHSLKWLLALETLNGNYRIGNYTGGNRITNPIIRLDYYVGSVINSVDVSTLSNLCTLGAPTCTTDCAARWGNNPPQNAFTGYFTERSISKIWRQNRNTWKMTNAGYWPGQKPYTTFLSQGNRRCQTFASFTCTNLTLSQNDSIADVIIASKSVGDCMPECSTCDYYYEPWWEYQPYTDCPTPTNGSLTFKNPNANMQGTWRVYLNGSLWGSGSLPASSIPVTSGYSGGNGNNWTVELDRQSFGCPIISRSFTVYTNTYTGVCSNAPTPFVMSTQAEAGSCLRTNSGIVYNRFQANSLCDSVRVGPVNANYTKYNEYQSTIATNVPNPPNTTTYIHVFAKKGALTQHGSYTFPMRTCPCITNRYVVFNALGISAVKKTTLENMGWKVSP